jgi:RimJ/RimL family protein N-acetyltransferase
MRLEPVTLIGAAARLEPLRYEHAAELVEAALDPELWRWTISIVRDEAEMRDYISQALEGERAGTTLPFVIREQGTGRAIGSTRFGNIDGWNRRLEIGWTWVAAPWQRSAINTECKLLLMRHAFETAGCNRVEFKTDALNEKSRRALRGIGATEEGILRQHMVTLTGRVRDTVYFSVIASEWPSVRAHLEARLQRAPLS